MTEKWRVNPDYGKENVYTLWDENWNYHDDTSPETMDARAQLMAAAPELLRTVLALCEEFRQYDLPYGSAAYSMAQDVLLKATGEVR